MAGTGDSAVPLAGFVVVLTCDRRADELAASFTRRGARVNQAATLRMLSLADDDGLIELTRGLIRQPPEAVVVTTAIGFRSWIESADAAGLAPHLLDVLSESKLLARGPKARGAIRAAGLVEAWSASGETTAEAVDFLLSGGVAGRRVVVQAHGATDVHQLERLSRAGAIVSTVETYAWGPAPDPVAVRRAVEAVCQRTVDAIVFTSAPASAAFLRAAQDLGRHDELVTALRADVLAAAVGPVTARPLADAGITALIPDRARLGALVRATTDHLAGHGVRLVHTRVGDLELRGQGVTLAGRPVTLSPAPAAILRALARHPGAVVDRETLRSALPGALDLHAVEVTVGRLRTALGSPGIIQTVVKRGYRLAVG